MAKTEVILTHNVIGLGGESDLVKVAAGYARNYLFPQGLAVPVTGANQRRLDALKARRAEREGKELTAMTELSQTLSKITLKLPVKTGEDGKLFGSVTAGTIADELKHQYDVSLDKRKIHVATPIKTLGDHDVELRLHANMTTTLKVKVESTTPKPEAPAAPAQPENKDRGGDRGTRFGGRPTAEAPRAEKAEKAEKPEKSAEAKPERKARGSKSE